MAAFAMSTYIFLCQIGCGPVFLLFFLLFVNGWCVCACSEWGCVYGWAL